MNKFPYAAKAVLLGLLTTHILATLQVYMSNTDLYRTVMAVTEAGYLAIPNERVAPSLKEFGPAFYGACFFALSIGAGLSILWVVCAWIWDRISGRHYALFLPLGLLWLSPLVAVNWRGFCPMASSYFVVTPLVVFACTLIWIPKEAEPKPWVHRLIPVLPIALLTMIWTAHADEFLFLDIRDYLLLSNPVGKKVDDFYYRYTLYPAEVFKPLEQKTLRTSRLASIEDEVVAGGMERVLMNHDYLPVAEDAPVDLEIVESGNALIFKHRGQTVLQSTSKEFLAKPEMVLKYSSMAADRHAFFRQATILCLLVGYPITLYVMVFALILFILRFFVDSARSSVITAAICFLIGLALLAPISIGRWKTVGAMDVPEALRSKRWQQRVTALRTVVEKEMEVGSLPAYHDMLASPHVPERYWWAKALGVSRDEETYQDLLTLLDDPHPDVVSMAFHALGQRGDPRALKEILRRIETSDHWYNQWYAYKALRDLGWRQTRPKDVLPWKPVEEPYAQRLIPKSLFICSGTFL